MSKNITFNYPLITNKATKNINNLRKKKHYAEEGFYSKKCSAWLKKNIKCSEALMVHSCTAALEICAYLLNLKPDDEVILPSYTFVSTANAFAIRGAKPIFVDIDSKTVNIDTKKIENKITRKTKAIVIVHYAGISCNLEEIISLKNKYKLILIEDAAQALLSKYKNKFLGSIGDLATLSFHETKNIHCGTGGALLINNKKFIKKALIIKQKGTNKDLFQKKIVKKYTWVGLGSSYSMNEICASILYSQFQRAKQITNNRKKIWLFYHRQLEYLEKQNLIKRPFVRKF